MAIILGIDPGSRVTGFGLIETLSQKRRYITSGIIRVVGKSLDEQLDQIYQGISQVVRDHQPDEVAVEQVFVHQNPRSALKLGQARGAAIVAAVSQAVKLAEYSPREIKQAVVGYGGADKEQVQYMIKLLLNLNQAPAADAADALAVALCHAQVKQTRLRMENS